jgi:hypothetical protein
MKDLNQQMQADVDHLIDQLDRLRNWLNKPTTVETTPKSSLPSKSWSKSILPA